MALIRFTVSGNFETGGFAENVYTYDTDEEVDGANAYDVISDFIAYFLSDILPVIADYIWDGFVFNSVRLEKCTDVPEQTWVSLGESFFSGPGAYILTSILPEFVATRVSFGISDPGRGGSKFLSGMVEADWNSTTWGNLLLAALADYALACVANFVGTASGIFFTPGVFQTSEDVGLGFSAFNGTFAVDITASHQVRREAGIGI